MPPNAGDDLYGKKINKNKLKINKKYNKTERDTVNPGYLPQV